MAYINSKKISAYPVVNRDTSVSGDIYSRHTSEEIFSGIVNKFMSSDGFVITQKEDFGLNKPFAFNIHGYYFNVSNLEDILNNFYTTEVKPIKDDVIWAKIAVKVNGTWKELDGGDTTNAVTPDEETEYYYTGVDFIKCNTAEEKPECGDMEYIWPLMIFHGKDASIYDWAGTGWNVPYTSYIKFTGKDFYCDTIDGGDFDIKAAPVFGDYNWLQIKAYVDAGKAENMWNLGDTHILSCNDKTYTAMIYHFSGAETLDNGSPAKLVLGTREQLGVSKYMPTKDSLQKYFDSDINTFCATNIYANLDPDFKSVIEKWKCIVGIENNTREAVQSTYTQSVYVGVPACKEVGLTNLYNQTENDSLVTFNYFADKITANTRRAKEGTEDNPIITWWLRSPGKYISFMSTKSKTPEQPTYYYKGYFSYCIMPKDDFDASYGLNYVDCLGGICPIFCM